MKDVVTYLNKTLVGHEEVRNLQITMNHEVFVKITQSFEQLQHNAFHLYSRGLTTRNAITCDSVKGFGILSNRLAISCSQYSITKKIL